jgi:hypothetical protein
MTGFTEDDYNSLSKFVNFVTRNAEFRLNVAGNIELYNYLAKIQKELLPKIEAHILEVKSVTTPKKGK